MTSMKMSLAQVLMALRARRRVVAVICAATTFSAVLVGAFLPRHYAAPGSVLVDVTGGNPLMGEPSYEPLVPNYLATQVDIATSQRVVGRVVHRLRAQETPDTRRA